MDSNRSSRVLLPCLAMVMLVFGLAKSDIEKDKEQCAQQLVGLATCLPYVGGQARTPPVDCCTGLKQVLQKSKVCLCILIKDRDDPSLGLKINATLALGLPDTCHSPVNITECPGLMHLPPNSPDAKIFEDFGKSNQKSNSNSTTTPSGNASTGTGGSSSEINSDGGRGRKWLGVEKFLGVSLMIVVMLHFHIPNLS